MPGHVAKAEGPDPDPLPWLAVSDELSIKLKAKPYDAKKSCWVPCPKDGFAQGDIRGVKGDQITVFASNKVCKIHRNIKYVHSKCLILRCVKSFYFLFLHCFRN